MLETLARWARAHLPDPARAGLGWWLTAIQLALVLLVGGGLSWYASGMLHDLADQQAKARVQLAATTAREDLRRMGEDAHATARALADRPTLQRLLAEGQNEALPPFLRHWCAAGGVEACAVLSGKTVVAVSGPALDWQQIVTAGTEQGGTFMALPATERVPLLGARAALSDGGLTVYVVRRLDEKLAASLSAQVGAEVRLIDYRTYTSAPVNAFTPLYAAALADGHSAVRRIDSQDLYAASVPVFAASGEAIALIEARLPTSAVDAPARQLVRKLLTAALILGALAHPRRRDPRRSSWPARCVRSPPPPRASGAGDFSASIPPGGAAEVGALARTMEDMRRNLIELTSTLRRREAEAQAVLAGIVEGVYAVDKNRIIRYLNPQAARLLGVTPRAGGRALLRRCAATARGRRSPALRVPLPDPRGTRRRQRQGDRAARCQQRRRRRAPPSSRAPRRSTGLQVQVMRDETELEAVRRARDSVLANISHEFRTPLAAQLASIELLLDGLDTMRRRKQRELVASLERGTLRLTQLIDNLLESVRIESGQLASAARASRLPRSWRTRRRWSDRCSRSAASSWRCSCPRICRSSTATRRG